jgi:hypothetical protein
MSDGFDAVWAITGKVNGCFTEEHELRRGWRGVSRRLGRDAETAPD